MGKSAVILAGGEGKRMKSDKPKALSKVLDKPMLEWVIDSVVESGIGSICVLTGFGRAFIDEFISEYTERTGIKIDTAFQAERLGTGRAVMMCRDFLCKNPGDVVVLNGDAPFMDSEAISGAYEFHADNDSSATVISAGPSASVPSSPSQRPGGITTLRVFAPFSTTGATRRFSPMRNSSDIFA